MSTPSVGPRRIMVGVVGAPHGIRGELRIKSYMAVPAAIADHALFTAEAGGRGIRIVAARALKDDMVVVRLDGVTTREAAAALTNKPLFIDRAALPPADENEFYHADLVGLAVRTTEGEEVGRIAAVLDFGGGDLLDIATPDRRSILVSFTRAFVPTVDIAGGVVLVTPEAVAEADEDAAPDNTQGIAP